MSEYLEEPTLKDGRKLKDEFDQRFDKFLRTPKGILPDENTDKLIACLKTILKIVKDKPY